MVTGEVWSQQYRVRYRHLSWFPADSLTQRASPGPNGNANGVGEMGITGSRAGFALALCGALAIAGCSTTVTGTPVADPVALEASLDVGSYPKTPHKVPALDARSARVAEASRLADAVPLPRDVDPALRYNGSGYIGDRKSLGLSLTLSSSVQDAAGSFEYGAHYSANDQKPGESGSSKRSMSAAVLRMADATAATKAVAYPDFAKPDKFVTEKAPVTIAGFPTAKAYVTEWKTLGTWAYVAMLPVGEYVVAAYVSMPSRDDVAKAVSTFFDRTQKGLAGYKATPLDKLQSQAPDPNGVVRLTMPDKTGEAWSTPISAAGRASDIDYAVKLYKDTGVDFIGYGDSTVTRTRDDAAAKEFVTRESDWLRTNRTGGSVPTQIRLAPGAFCWAYPKYSGSKETKTHCIVARGRYVASSSDAQTAKVMQAINASYFVLGDPK